MEAANAYAKQKGLQGFVISQIQWSLSVPDWQATADPTMRCATNEEILWHSKTKIPIAAYSATGNGFFSKPCTTTSPINRHLWELIQSESKKIGSTPTQLALAWLLFQKPTVLPVFSTTNLNHLVEILSADHLELDNEVINKLTLGKKGRN
jgi:aryl-alcohol dehydrogenase-like predicted oxidoreductase